VPVILARDGEETAVEELVRRHQHQEFAVALCMYQPVPAALVLHVLAGRPIARWPAS